MVKTIVTFLSELAFTYYMYMQYYLLKLKQKMFNYTSISHGFNCPMAFFFKDKNSYSLFLNTINIQH